MEEEQQQVEAPQTEAPQTEAPQTGGDPKVALAKQLGELLVQHDIDAKVQIYRESVCALAADAVQEKTTVMVHKDLPAA